MKSFDLIIGSDILYEMGTQEALASVCERHLQPRGRILLADPGRLGAESFITLMERRGWAWDLIAERAAVGCRVNILGFHRPTGGKLP